MSKIQKTNKQIAGVIKCVVLHFIKLLQSANVLISQTAKRYKYYMAKSDKLFCYIYHVIKVNLRSQLRYNPVNS